MTKGKPRTSAILNEMGINETTRMVVDQTLKTRNIEIFTGSDAPEQAMAYAAKRAADIRTRPVAVFALIAGFGQTVAAMPIGRDTDIDQGED